MNINLKINVKHVNMDILKQKMNYAFIVNQKNMEAQGVMNVAMKKMKMVKKQIILFAKIASLLINILHISMNIILNIIFSITIIHLFYHLKKNVIFLNMLIHLIYA